jgi:hypothetical protein
VVSSFQVLAIKILHAFLILRATCTIHLILLDLMNLVISGASRGSSVNTDTKLRAGRPGFISWQVQLWEFSLRHGVETGRGAQPAFYPVDAGKSNRADKAAKA